MNLSREAEMILAEYEVLHTKVRGHRKRNLEIYDKGEALERELEGLRGQLRALFSPFTEGPPPGVDRTHVFARGAELVVEVQFKRKSDSYDPAKLPAEVLRAPGVVTAIAKTEVDRLAHRFPSISNALVEGTWLTPVVQVKPRS